jgi:hypothetical protein
MYHYCSGATFQSIIENRTIRYSDINLLNDAEEGRWGYDIFLQAAKRILDRANIPEILPIIPVEFIDLIDSTWHNTSFSLTSFLACFSLEGDSLSQWRAYADDGRGFSIGFGIKEMANLPVQILDVLYDPEEQVREMIIAVGAMYMEMEDESKQGDYQWILDQCLGLKSSAVAFKNPAWRDEREIRCQHVVLVDLKTDAWKFEAAGEGAEGKSLDPIDIEFQVRGEGMIVPYFDMPFKVTSEALPIKEVWAGPKNPNGFGNVKFFMSKHGLGGVEVKRAGGAYR